MCAPSAASHRCAPSAFGPTNGNTAARTDGLIRVVQNRPRQNSENSCNHLKSIQTYVDTKQQTG